MRLIVDANVILSAILGRANRLSRVMRAGGELAVVDAQLAEARDVLIKFGTARSDAERLVTSAVEGAILVGSDDVAIFENDARARLDDRGQSDWPVLAGALAFGAAIWSDDRDFFGVGVPVWSTRTVHLAI